MLALIQRVSEASVSVDGEVVAAIGPGLVVFVGIERDDGEQEADALARRVRALRAFSDSEGRMNEPLGDREVLCVSQFTLCADTSKGRRPGFGSAAPSEVAEPLYERFRDALDAEGGVFGAEMSVALVNDGPVTLLVRP